MAVDRLPRRPARRPSDAPRLSGASRPPGVPRPPGAPRPPAKGASPTAPRDRGPRSAPPNAVGACGPVAWPNAVGACGPVAWPNAVGACGPAAAPALRAPTWRAAIRLPGALRSPAPGRPAPRGPWGPVAGPLRPRGPVAGPPKSGGPVAGPPRSPAPVARSSVPADGLPEPGARPATRARLSRVRPFAVRCQGGSPVCEAHSWPVRTGSDGLGGGSSSMTAQVWVEVRSAAASLTARAEYPGSASIAPPPLAAMPSHAARVDGRFHGENWPGG